MDKLLDISERASRIVVLPAGEGSASLLKLYGELGAGNICTICDNSPVVQGKFVGDREVISVECAVRAYPDAHFVIVHKRHTQEIYEQLVRFGVTPERIYVCLEKVYTGNAVIKYLMTR